MEILEIDNQTYKKKVLKPFCRFNKAEFYALNSHKVDEVKYMIFNDGKDRFSLVLGIKDKIAKAPFSASFEAFSEITENNKIIHYHDAVSALVNWCQQHSIKQVKVSLPPAYYNVSHITKIENALLCNGFRLSVQDVNFEYYIEEFDENYENEISYNAKKSLKKSERNGLLFEKTEAAKIVYDVIKQNREEKGYPLWMSYNDVIETSKIIPSDYFLVKDSEGKAIASALVHQINDEILRVVYWGNLMDANKLCPMNFLSYNIFKYYKQTNFKIIDIGPSTEDGKPNFGLCDFKEGIGCHCSSKNTYILDNGGLNGK